jgi:hypothetical protein
VHLCGEATKVIQPSERRLFIALLKTRPDKTLPKHLAELRLGHLGFVSPVNEQAAACGGWSKRTWRQGGPV